MRGPGLVYDLFSNVQAHGELDYASDVILLFFFLLLLLLLLFLLVLFSSCF